MKPAVGTRLTGKGVVISHDVTGYGLHRLCVAANEKYPDLLAWLEFLDKRVLLTRHDQKFSAGRMFTGYVWFYWKDE